MRKFDDNLLEFTTREKLAIIRMMEKIAKGNHQIAPEEMDYMVNMVNYLGMTSGDVYKAKELNLKDVGTIFNQMTDAKKKVLRGAARASQWLGDPITKKASRPTGADTAPKEAYIPTLW